MSEKTAVVKISHGHNRRAIEKPRKAKRENIFLEHMKYCLSVSSLHGLNQIVWSNRSPFERLIWICAVVGLTAFGISKGYEVFEHYFERPCVTSVEMDYENWINDFPSFTLCQKELDEHSLLSRNITKGSEMYEYLNDLAFANYTTYSSYQKYANGSKKELLKPEQYLKVLFEVVPTVSSDGNVFPYNQERPILTTATEIGICSVLNPSVGIYYTPKYFNSSRPYKSKPVVYGHKIIVLKFELKNFTHSYKVALHSAHEIVNIDTKMDHFPSTTVTIFTASTLSVWTPESVESLSVHQRKCKLVSEADDLDHSPVYTYNLCKIECRIKLCLKFCHCTPYFYRRNPGEKICDMAGMYCLSKHSDKLINLLDRKNKSMCNCYQNCQTMIVAVDDVMSTAWFADTRMTIQLLDHPNIRYVRKLIFTKLDLLVQIGGILGLCLGCTILGIIEVVYFMTLRFYWGAVRGKSIRSSL